MAAEPEMTLPADTFDTRDDPAAADWAAARTAPTAGHELASEVAAPVAHHRVGDARRRRVHAADL